MVLRHALSCYDQNNLSLMLSLEEQLDCSMSETICSILTVYSF